MVARWLLPLALLLAGQAQAQDSLEGSWALQAGGATIFRFDLEKSGDGKWRGTWAKPTAFASDGNRFSRLTGPEKQVHSSTALDTPDGIELAFDDPTPGAVPDIFDFKPIDSDAVEMTYVGTDLAPYTLTRVRPGTRLGPWEAGKVYSRGQTGDAQPKIVPQDVLGNFLGGKAPPPEPKAAEDQPAEPAPPPADFKLKPGAPVGR
jgi:hypothetical protein